MNDRSNLVRTPITDKRGKQTTVYRRPAAALASAAALPVPSVAEMTAHPTAAPDHDPEYSERREAIRVQNEKWRAGDRADAGESRYEALRGMQMLTWLVAESDHRPSAEQLCRKLTAAVDWDRPSCIALAARYAAFYCVAANDSEACWGEEGDESPYWERYGAADAAGALTVASALLSLDLIAHTGIEKDGPLDPRIAAHIWAHATGTFDYSQPIEEVGGAIRAIDARPDDVLLVRSLYEPGMHEAAILAVLGGMSKPLSRGAL